MKAIDISDNDGILQMLAQWVEDDFCPKVISLATSIASLESFRDTKVQEAQRWLKSLLGRIADAIETTLPSVVNEHSLQTMLCGERSSGSDEDEMFELMSSIFFFYDDLDRAFGPCRVGGSVLDEFRKRLDVIDCAAKSMFYHDPESDPETQLRVWSSLYVKEKQVNIADANLQQKLPNMMKALQVLRHLSVAPTVTAFVAAHLRISDDGDEPLKKVEGPFLPLASQLRGVLPPECGIIIDEAAAFKTGHGVVSRLDKGQPVNIIELARDAGLVRSVLGGTSTPVVKDVVSRVLATYQENLKTWKTKTTVCFLSLSFTKSSSQ